MKRFFYLTIAFACALFAKAADPTATDYSFDQCEGSLTPYPTDIHPASYPDSLEPVFINHVGRHGARYPSSSANCLRMQSALAEADSTGTITPLGRKLRTLIDEEIRLSTNRWGALDSLGMAEQQAIAGRMFYNYTEVFSGDKTVQAYSSYSPRAMMSMYAFTHQLDRMSNRLTFTTSTGRVNSDLLRPFDIDKDYLAFRRDKTWEPPYAEYLRSSCPTTAIKRVLGDKFDFKGAEQELALTEYYTLAGLRAMGLPSAMSVYFTPAEANALWSCFNLRQYLQRTATTVSTVPADIASDLVLNLVETTDNYINNTSGNVSAILRFGHAETLMPLSSLLRLPGCYYLTNYFDTVSAHWRDFDVVPMAANIQFILFRSRNSGRYYMQVLLNEEPVAMRKGDSATIYPWGELKRFMMNCVPLHAQ